MQKGVVILVVVTMLIVLTAFALLNLHFIENQSIVVERHVSRIKALEASKAAVIYATKRLDNGDSIADITKNVFSLNNLDVTISIFPNDGTVPACQEGEVVQYCIHTIIK